RENPVNRSYRPTDLRGLILRPYSLFRRTRMRTFVRGLVLLTALLAMPALAFAQDATLTGTITDTTGGALPGVTVTATNNDTGNTFVAVTDGRGTYRIPVRVGQYRLSADLSGFNTINRS